MYHSDFTWNQNCRFCHFRGSEFANLVIFSLQKVQKRKKCIKMTLFGPLKSPILVSRKIWVIEKLWNVHTVFGKAKTRLTGNSAFWLYQKWTFSEPQPFNIVFFQQCAVFSHLSNYNSQMFNFGRFLATKNVQNFWSCWIWKSEINNFAHFSEAQIRYHSIVKNYILKKTSLDLRHCIFSSIFPHL